MKDMDHNCIGNGCRFAGCEQASPTLTATEGSGAEPGARLGAKPLPPAFYEWARSLPATDATVLTASPEGYDDGTFIACTCNDTCRQPCRGDCGCRACHLSYQDALSDDYD